MSLDVFHEIWFKEHTGLSETSVARVESGNKLRLSDAFSSRRLAKFSTSVVEVDSCTPLRRMVLELVVGAIAEKATDTTSNNATS